MENIKLTQYSHGAGCGCKIAPNVLHEILSGSLTMPDNKKLLVGNHTKDDAAVYAIDENQAMILTTDFFMPIVDDPYQFGRIASANAISDVYAMGGKPTMAIAILGWPINILSPAIASRVIEGSKSMCIEAGIPLAGGHSIDAPEPIFGLAVNGLIPIENIKQNNGAKPNDLLFLTKALGIGILTTAEKKSILKPEHKSIAAEQMMVLNKVGHALGKIKGVNAMTDVTGFGLLGHLNEMCEGSKVGAELHFNKIPIIDADIYDYLKQNSIPGGTIRNLNAYGEKIVNQNKTSFGELTLSLLADPQTSGGLLVAVSPESVDEVIDIFTQFDLSLHTSPIGKITEGDKIVIR